MSELHDLMRQAMEAQGKVAPDEVFAVMELIHEDEEREHERPPIDYTQETFALERGAREHEEPTPAAPTPTQTGDTMRMHVDLPPPITWEEFFTNSEVGVTKRVRRGQQQLGPAAREWIARATGGSIGDGGRSRKQFVNTRQGRYRISLSVDGDNTTETAAHDRMGVETLSVENVEQMVTFLDAHGLDGQEAYEELRAFLRDRVRQA